MKLINEDRHGLARGEDTALINFLADSSWFWALCCIGIWAWGGKVWGIIAFTILGLVYVVLYVCDCIGDHRYQMKIHGRSDWTDID